MYAPQIQPPAYPQSQQPRAYANSPTNSSKKDPQTIKEMRDPSADQLRGAEFESSQGFFPPPLLTRCDSSSLTSVSSSSSPFPTGEAYQSLTNTPQSRLQRSSNSLPNALPSHIHAFSLTPHIEQTPTLQTDEASRVLEIHKKLIHKYLLENGELTELGMMAAANATSTTKKQADYLFKKAQENDLEDVLLSLARSNGDNKILDALFRTQNPNIMDALAENKHFVKDRQHWLKNQFENPTMKQILKIFGADAKVDARLLEPATADPATAEPDEMQQIQHKLENENTDSHTLYEIADQCLERFSQARQFFDQYQLFEALTKVTKHANTDMGTLEILFDNYYVIDLRFALASNPKVFHKLEKWLNSLPDHLPPEQHFRLELAKNPKVQELATCLLARQMSDQ